MGMKMYEPAKILSDGDKIVVIVDGRSYAMENGFVSSFDFQIDNNLQEMRSFGSDFTEMVSGGISSTLNLTIKGGLLNISDKVDIIDQEKVKEFTKQVNQEVKQIALRRAIEF